MRFSKFDKIFLPIALAGYLFLSHTEIGEYTADSTYTYTTCFIKHINKNSRIELEKIYVNFSCPFYLDTIIKNQVKLEYMDYHTKESAFISIYNTSVTTSEIDSMDMSSFTKQPSPYKLFDFEGTSYVSSTTDSTPIVYMHYPDLNLLFMLFTDNYSDSYIVRKFLLNIELKSRT